MLSGDELGVLALMYASVIRGTVPNSIEMSKFERLIQKQALARRLKPKQFELIRNLLREGKAEREP